MTCIKKYDRHVIGIPEGKEIIGQKDILRNISQMFQVSSKTATHNSGISVNPKQDKYKKASMKYT